MAIENQVLLYGQLQAKPQIYQSEDFSQALCQLLVVSGRRDNGLNRANLSNMQILQTSIPLVTREARWLSLLGECDAGDLILVKGVVTTKNCLKKKNCPKCGGVHEKAGVMTFVTPISIKLQEKGLSPEEGLKCLIRDHEISNWVSFMGTVIADPEYRFRAKVPGFHQRYVAFQLAADRSYFNTTDDPSVRTDYPWVRVFGKKNGESVMKRCHKDTVVYIDGFLQRDEVAMQIPCDSEGCDGVIDWKDYRISIVALKVEYLRDFNSDALLELPDDLDEEETRNCLAIQALRK